MVLRVGIHTTLEFRRYSEFLAVLVVSVNSLISLVGLPDHSKWKVGRDFFWFVEDIAAYITKYGYDDRNPTNVLPKENFLHDFDDPSWSIDRRIVNIALEGSRVERERLPLLLQRSGWKILSRDSNKKRQDIAYIPAWNADTINWDTMVNYTLNFDFFKELDEVEKHLKV